MNIRQAGIASGLRPETIRFYERRAVVPSPPRRQNGYRDYTDEHVAVLRFAKGLRELNLPLKEIARLVTFAHDGTCGRLRTALLSSIEDTQAELQERIEVLRHTQRTLAALHAGLVATMPRASAPMRCRCVDLVLAEDEGPRPRNGRRRRSGVRS
ncbi:MAG TPA: MerR family transcriptional regulator [Dehalococcoidia bacterium]|nr:MerR family transcriptional regulator [Dehalococcoidia bacterium]